MPLTTDTKKVMFEIYREADFSGRYKVVYFTELGEHDKETEIQEAMRGEHVFDGFLLHRERNQAKQVVDEILERLNRGENRGRDAIKRACSRIWRKTLLTRTSHLKVTAPTEVRGAVDISTSRNPRSQLTASSCRFFGRSFLHCRLLRRSSFLCRGFLRWSGFLAPALACLRALA